MKGQLKTRTAVSFKGNISCVSSPERSQSDGQKYERFTKFIFKKLDYLENYFCFLVSSHLLGREYVRAHTQPHLSNITLHKKKIKAYAVVTSSD